MTTPPLTQLTPTPHWGPHLRGLVNVPTVETLEVEETKIRMQEAARARGLMIVTGPVGAGKSHAAGRAAEICQQDTVEPAEIMWLELARSTSEWELLSDLTYQLTNVDPPRTARLRSLRHDLTDVLAERHRVLIVDEAQHMSRQRILTLRWLHDHPDADFALVLVGTPDLTGRLAPEVKSRCSRRVVLEPIADADIVANLHTYDPLFQVVSPAYLKRLNREHARGRWRWWAQFLYTARQYTAASNADLTNEDVLAAVVDAVT